MPSFPIRQRSVLYKGKIKYLMKISGTTVDTIATYGLKKKIFEKAQWFKVDSPVICCSGN